MSLLDDLKKQAAAKESSEPLDGGKAQQLLAERNWHRLSPKMFLIYNYLKELAENLNVVLPQDAWEFELNDTIKIRGMVREKYRVDKKDQDALKSFDFRYDLATPYLRQVKPGNVLEAEKLRSVLKVLPLTTYTEIVEDNQLVFTIEPKIMVCFNYTADLEKCVVLLTIHHYRRPWPQHLRYDPDQITDELMDEMGKFVLGQPNRFMELSGYQVPDATRELLRNELNREKELGQNARPEPEAAAAPENKSGGLFGRLKK